MHELGVLIRAVRTVDQMAKQHNIERVKHITLEVGKDSTFVPAYFEKLFPAAIDAFETMKDAILNIEMVEGRGLVIKDFGY
ncbi:MAG: hydrogenase maturation nickel metallochaperone HypA [Firmicutes bacterium]|nr:hydrogenase maturation nickel metallochaperone HypA [Bacillota bacterium]MBQ4504086.1 hydrogenase maturation nickel metallochaperone HypA [Bacillota bacterium]MBQ6686296.1 hydrogenase maturation nickel metallochaperone HypA [Bacillota bacterium]MBQ6948155.1 hydrogenase maturation nickel metallochaperone HypA [Bacillota bacterium]